MIQLLSRQSTATKGGSLFGGQAACAHIAPDHTLAVGPMGPFIFSVRTTRLRSNMRSLFLKIIVPINGPRLTARVWSGTIWVFRCWILRSLTCIRDDSGIARDDSGMARDDSGMARDDNGIARDDNGIARDENGVVPEGSGVVQEGIKSDIKLVIPTERSDEGSQASIVQRTPLKF